MELVCVFLTRKYDSDDYPELYAAHTNFDHDFNPDYIEEKYEEAKALPDVESAKIIRISFSEATEDEIRRLMRNHVTVNAKDGKVK